MNSISYTNQLESSRIVDECVQNKYGSLAHMVLNAKGFLTSAEPLDLGAEWAVAIEARYNLKVFTPLFFHSLGIRRPHFLNRAVPSRQGEFLVGRIIAREVLRILNSPNLIVDVGDHRAPVWPTGYSGSISHSAGRCICVVAAETQVHIGVDLQQIECGSNLEDIVPLVLSPVERQNLTMHNMFPIDVLITLIFSAKETLFKALYPFVRDYFDFGEASVTDISKNIITLVLTQSLAPTLAAGRSFLIHFYVAENYVRTWLVEKH